MLSYQQCITLLFISPKDILYKIAGDINFKVNYNIRVEMIQEFKKTKKERKSNIDYYKKFQMISNRYFPYYLRNLHIYLKNDIKEYLILNKSTIAKQIFFLEIRENLIELLNSKIITKSKFIDLNFTVLELLQMEPFTNINSINNIIFNYNYFNSLIKYKTKYHGRKKDLPYYNLSIEDLYKKKDEMIVAILNHKEAQSNIKSYFIKVDSGFLHMKLYEIYIPDYNIIMHSVNNDIRKTLQKEGCFERDIKSSLISDYVNTKIKE